MRTFIVALAACAAVAAHAGYVGGGLSTGRSVSSRSEDGLGNYKFSYNEQHSSGGSWRSEAGNKLGVSGSYGLTDVDGRVRVVNYVADGHGFRASVKTNEPGTEQQPAAGTQLVATNTVAAGSVQTAKVDVPVQVQVPVVTKSVSSVPVNVAVPVATETVVATPAVTKVAAAPVEPYGYHGAAVAGPVGVGHHYGAALAAPIGVGHHYGAAPVAAPVGVGHHYGAAVGHVGDVVARAHAAPVYGQAVQRSEWAYGAGGW